MGNYKTLEYEINAFRFFYDTMPTWFMNQVSSKYVIIFNYGYDKYAEDKAFCIINAKSYNREVVNPGEFILESDYNFLIKIHPDKFLSKYETK